MFTGIVEARVPVLSFERRGTGARLLLPAPQDLEEGSWSVSPGDSVAVSGVCLTVVEWPGEGEPMGFDLSAETLERSWLGELEPGRTVNLERALCLGERLGGHLVAGHVDATGRLLGSEDAGDGGRTFRFEVPAGFERYLVDKGSVTLDGISLTVVAPRGREFSVAVIPVTLERTSLGMASAGQPINLEADLVGKWIEQLTLHQAAGS